MTRERERTVFALVILAGVWLAYEFRFLQDDAFISFRYARNLADGLGLIWQPGETAQGYTNFLWTVMLGGAHWMGARLEDAAIWLGLAHYLGALILFAALARRLFPGGWLALGLLVVLATNYSVLRYATGGLETMQQCFWMLLAAWIALGLNPDRASVARLLAMSLCFAAQMLVRFDSAIFIVVLTLSVLLAGPRADIPRRFLWLFAPAAAIFSAYCAWALGTYGDILPNTFHVKTGGSATGRLGDGVWFALHHLTRYQLLLPLVAGLGAVIFLRPAPVGAGLAGYCLAWLGYVVWTGGDFMEFRLMVGWTPFALLLMGYAWRAFAPSGVLPGFAAVTLLAGVSAYHGATNPGVYRGVESIPRLIANLHGPDANWVGVGRALGAAFPDAATGPVIAVNPAGAIPFYADLPSFDMLGLNHKGVAESGVAFTDMPGHRRIAAPDEIVRRGVNLIIAHPIILAPGPDPARQLCGMMRDKAFAGARPPEPLLSARFVTLPLSETQRVGMLYAVPHPEVDAALERGAMALEAGTLRACYDPQS